MANVSLGFPNRTDEATLGAQVAGSWTSGAPLTRLQTMIYSETAVSTNASASSTKFSVQLTTARPIKLISLGGHNLTTAGTCRFRGYTDSGLTTMVADSGTVYAYPTVPFGSYDWSDPSFWSGTITDEQRAFYPSIVTYVFPQTVIARYWLIEIFDTANPAGYVSIGRLFMCPVWTPTYNAQYGLQFGHTTTTQIESSVGGVDFAERRPIIREVKFALDALDDVETYGPGFNLTRQQGIDKEVFLVFDSDDPYYTVQRSWPGRLKSLPSFVIANYSRNSTAFELKELI